jgi:hypothetical protein
VPFDSSLPDSNLTDFHEPPRRERSFGPVKRPHNAYNLYFIERLQVEKDIHPELSGNEISQLIGKTWSEMDEEARRPYRERARDIHDKFKEEFPDYHYQKASERKKAVPRTLQQIAGEADQSHQKVM